jgi:hypothetical protein
MKKLLPFLFTAFLFACGGGGGGESVHVTGSFQTLTPISQDLHCCAYYDDEANSCTQWTVPNTPESNSFTISIEQEGEEESFTFTRCTVKYTPVGSYSTCLNFTEAKTLDFLSQATTCTSTDIEGSSASGIVAPTAKAVETIWNIYNSDEDEKKCEVLVTYNVEATLEYVGQKSGTKVTKTLRFTIEFDDFWNGEHDDCEETSSGG